MSSISTGSAGIQQRNDNAPHSQVRVRPGVGRRGVGLAVGALAALMLLGVGWRTWQATRYVEATSDAYLRADGVAAAPKIAGYVSAVFVADNQAVQPGDKLVQIDPENYRVAVAQDAASLAARRAQLVIAQTKARAQQAVIAHARAVLAGTRANADFAAAQARRYARVAASGAESAEKLAEMRNAAAQAQANLQADAAALNQAEREAETLAAEITLAEAQRDEAVAAAGAAALDLQNTIVRASIAGRVGDKAAQVGQFVQPGTRLMSLVPTQDIYVVANFKETQTGRMRVGQKAEVAIDALDGQKVPAVLESFAPGTGAQFALLPPENATGNFTKIVQRVPVRFALLADAAIMARLLPGLSVTVSVDTGP